jgi:hypothetical protein
MRASIMKCVDGRHVTAATRARQRRRERWRRRRPGGFGLFAVAMLAAGAFQFPGRRR